MAAAIVLLGLWFGLLTGTLVAAIAIVRSAVLGQLVFQNHWVVWMAPLAHVLLFGAAGLVLAGIASGTGSRTMFGWSAATYGFLGTMSVLAPFPAVAWWATLLVAAGAGSRCRRAFAEVPARTARQLAPAAGVALLAVAVGSGIVARSIVMRARQRGAVPSDERKPPNILLVILDTVRGESLSLFGYPRPTTPYLERLAEEAVVFDRAFTTAPWTLPSHGAIMTGRYAEDLGGGWLKPLEIGEGSLARVLGEHGYATGGFVANLLYTTVESGLADGFQHYDDFPVSPRQVILHAPLLQSSLFRAIARGRKPPALWRILKTESFAPGRVPGDDYRPAPSVTDAFLRWQASQGDRPFFAFLNYFDAHGPYRAPEPYLARFRSKPGPTAKRDRYDAAIAYLDDEIRRLLTTLSDRGVLERTIVVITSDHGELFGEHGLEGHANALYLPLLKVPLIIRYPAAVPGGTRVARPVTLIDLPSTLLELAGVTPAALPGNPLASNWQSRTGAEPSRAFADLQRGRNVDSTHRNARTWLQGTLDDSLHYIRDGLGREELFRWASDSAEATNLAADPAHIGELEALRSRLDSVLGRQPARP
jgi:arylsulfatase A-like enzyme